MTHTRGTMWFFLGMLFALFLGMAGGTGVIAVVAASIGLVWLVGEGLDHDDVDAYISDKALDRLRSQDR